MLVFPPDVCPLLALQILSLLSSCYVRYYAVVYIFFIAYQCSPLTTLRGTSEVKYRYSLSGTMYVQYELILSSAVYSVCRSLVEYWRYCTIYFNGRSFKNLTARTLMGKLENFTNTGEIISIMSKVSFLRVQQAKGRRRRRGGSGERGARKPHL